jgi:hypothetical protein
MMSNGARERAAGPGVRPLFSYPPVSGGARALLALVLVLGAAAFGALIPKEATAQGHEHAPPGGREIQVPVDAAFLEITPQVRRQLGLFPDVENFAIARLFMLEGGSYVLEISSMRDGRIERTRTAMTEYDLRLFREDLESRLASSGSPLVRDREGRGGLVLRQTVLGVGFYGWAVPAILNLTDDRAQVATYLLTAGASFYLPYRLTRDVAVSDAHRSFVLWGGTRGIAHGALLGGILNGPETESEFQSSDGWDKRDRVLLGSALAGSIAGSYLAFKAVDWTGMDPGTARLWGAMGDFGILAGLGTAYAMGLYDEEPRVVPGDPVGFEEWHTPRLRLGHAVTLAAAGGGLYAGKWLGERERYTAGNVTALGSMAALGAHFVLPALELADADDKVMVAGAVAGGVGGIVIGNRMLRARAFTEGDGLILLAGHIAGGLTAAGITYLIVEDGSRENGTLLYLTTTALGSAAGFAFTYRALDGRRESAAGTLRPGGGGMGILPGRESTVTLSPSAALVHLLPAARSAGAVGTAGSREPTRVPMLTLRF